MSHELDLSSLAKESVWVDRHRYADAERDYYSNTNSSANKQGSADISANNPLAERLRGVERENQTLKKTVEQLSALVSKLEIRVSTLEGSSKPETKSAPKPVNQTPKPAPKQETKKTDDDDDDIDLFGSDVDEEADAVRQKRLDEYAAKKSKKPGVIAKSSVVLDVKPWDDETDMKVMEQEVRKIEMDGLLWGASKLVPLAYGIKKLQIVTVIEDDKVSVEELSEKIEAIEDFVQSVDIAAFNKI